jgi:hypothetical protein
VLADRTSRFALVAITIGLALILVAQIVAPSVTPVDATGKATGAALGSTGFAYLSGLRTFVAALLWNQMEPEFHQYYGGVTLEKQLYMLPSIRIVTWLDPQLQQAYYVGQWIVARNGKFNEALDLTREGIKANPHSGFLLTSYAELLFIHKDRAAAHQAALRAVATDVQWADALQQWDMYSILRDVFRTVGDTASLDMVLAKMKELDAAAARIGRQRNRGELQESLPSLGPGK